MNKLIFNWTAGAGGDFMLACAGALDNCGDNSFKFESNKHSNQWNVHWTYQDRTYFNTHNLDLINEIDAYVVTTHDPETAIELASRYNTTLLNINSKTSLYLINLIYMVKSAKASLTNSISGNKVLSHRFDSGDSSMINIKRVDSSRLIDVDYHDLFVEPNIDAITKVYDALLNRPITSFEAIKLVKWHYSYNSNNNHLIKNVSIDDIIDEVEENKSPSWTTKILTTIEDMDNQMQAIDDILK